MPIAVYTGQHAYQIEPENHAEVSSMTAVCLTYAYAHSLVVTGALFLEMHPFCLKVQCRRVLTIGNAHLEG